MENKTYDIILFHYPCQDGLASAWVANYFHTINNKLDLKLLLYPIQHGHIIDQTKLINKRVLFCDYSPSLEIIKQIEKIASKITILDHHISAKNALETIPYAIFDMNKSGAGLTWEYFFPDSRIPDFIEMIQDRDIWTWKLPNSRAFTAAFYMVCSSYEYDDFTSLFKLFNDLYLNKEQIKFYLEMGEILNKSNLLKAKNISNSHAKKVNQYLTHKVCIVNCSYEMASDVGNILSSIDDIDFAVLWSYHHPSEYYRISLRSNNKVDVSLIAQQFGGGGHINAAGFSTKVNPIELFNKI